MSLLASALFLLLEPGTVAVLVPWLITQWRPGSAPASLDNVRMAGLALAVAGGAVLLDAFGRFAWIGRGSPAPVLPTETLVISGLYRHLRNPMYAACTRRHRRPGAVVLAGGAADLSPDRPRHVPRVRPAVRRAHAAPAIRIRLRTVLPARASLAPSGQAVGSGGRTKSRRRTLNGLDYFFGCTSLMMKSISPGLMRPSSRRAISSIADGSSRSRRAYSRSRAFSARAPASEASTRVKSRRAARSASRPFSPTIASITRTAVTNPST